MMDPAPRDFGQLPRDAELGVPVPFACGTPAAGAAGAGPGAGRPSVRRLDSRRVTQCALSRVCGVCGASLGRPLAFLGSREEADQNAYHLPPGHLECVEGLLEELGALAVPLLGHAEPVRQWVLATAAAFEFVRPGRADIDRRPTFQPHAVLSEHARAGAISGR